MSDEKLLGDLTSEALRKMRADRVAKRFAVFMDRKKGTGGDCGCTQRREALNNFHKKIKGND